MQSCWESGDNVTPIVIQACLNRFLGIHNGNAGIVVAKMIHPYSILTRLCHVVVSIIIVLLLVVLLVVYYSTCCKGIVQHLPLGTLTMILCHAMSQTVVTFPGIVECRVTRSNACTQHVLYQIMAIAQVTLFKGILIGVVICSAIDSTAVIGIEQDTSFDEKPHTQGCHDNEKPLPC